MVTNRAKLIDALMNEYADWETSSLLAIIESFLEQMTDAQLRQRIEDEQLGK